MIRRGRDLDADLQDTADAVVVGTGAGGGMALRELARAGLKVIAVEEGGHHTPRDFTQREDEMLPLLFQDGGGRTTDDFAIRVLRAAASAVQRCTTPTCASARPTPSSSFGHAATA